MKKLLCALLCLCVLLSLCGLGVAATEPTETVTRIKVELDESGQRQLKFTVNGSASDTVEFYDSLDKTSWKYDRGVLTLTSGAFNIEIENINFSIKIYMCPNVNLQGLSDQGNNVTKIENQGGTVSIASDTIFRGEVHNETGSIVSGSFTGKVTNAMSGQISGGTFSGEVTNTEIGTISGGTFSGTVLNEGRISGGQFNGSVTNNATINGGTFDGEVENHGTITNGTDADGAAVVPTFSNTDVTNTGTISGGSFGESAAGINNKGKISGGTFFCGVGNNAEGAAIEGGTFHAEVSNERGASITGGTFSGTVHNSGSITGGTFAKDIVDNGGTVNLPQTDPDPAPVPQPVTPAPAEPVWDVEVEEEEEEIEVLKGSKQKYTQGSDEGLSFRFDAKVKNFRRLKIDGKTVDKANYEVTEGSTIITLDPEYMDTLKAGKHTLKAIFKDGSAEVKFTVLEGAKVEASAPVVDADKQNPSTGAAEFVGAVAALAVVSIAGAAALSKKH